ncbi:MAG: hydrogenase 4 subunit F [Myxococcota bacterium]|nr:hydrogenase 4 subunit F [Myxococcota bacterium]
MLYVSVLAFGGIAGYLGWRVFSKGTIFAADGWFTLDPLSAYHLTVMTIVFVLSTIFAGSYFRDSVQDGSLSTKRMRRFGALWLGSLAAMILVLISNHLGMMWVGIESTTLMTTFLICFHRSRESLEATWKYLLICSVGIAISFMGTLLAGASSGHIPGLKDPMLWSALRPIAASLDPLTMKASFIFLIVGFGTKAGLAPMHTWLPDAHSQAPAPVSAIFSGIMLNTALYCVMRYIPIVEGATGNAGWALGIVRLFGIVSMLIAAAFIIFQHDVKRLLAYHSVEHLGIIAVGVGLGGLGTFAAMFHTLNHSVCKSLGFFCAGRLGQMYETHDMHRMRGTLHVSPIWGIGLLLSLMALIGVAPFAVFMSELQIVKAALDVNAIVILVLFLASTGIVFVGALGHATSMAWGKAPEGVPQSKTKMIDIALVVAPLALLLLLGLWMPEWLRGILSQAADVISTTR